MAKDEKKTRNRTTANGEGGCKFVESKKLWRARMTVGWDGKKQIRQDFYGKTKREALEKLTAAQSRVLQGQAAVSSGMKLSDWADKWLEIYCRQLSPRTVSGYKSVVKNLIKPQIGEYALKNLKPFHVQQMITSLVEQGLSKSHVSRAKIITNAMCDDAVDNDLLIKNPCRKVELPPMADAVRSKEPFTDNEIKIIYEYSPQYLTLSLPHIQHRIGKIIIILIRTGLRQEELLALQWGDIDYDKDILKVRRAITILDGAAKIKAVKTFRSKRDIPMHKDVVDALKSMVQGKPEDYIFPTSKGGLWLPRNFQRDYKKFFVSAQKHGYDIKYRSPHICRHTFTSNLRAAGVDLKTISELLGHSRVNITADVYMHTDTQSRADAIAKL